MPHHGEYETSRRLTIGVTVNTLNRNIISAKGRSMIGALRRKGNGSRMDEKKQGGAGSSGSALDRGPAGPAGDLRWLLLALSGVYRDRVHAAPVCYGMVPGALLLRLDLPDGRLSGTGSGQGELEKAHVAALQEDLVQMAYLRLDVGVTDGSVDYERRRSGGDRRDLCDDVDTFYRLRCGTRACLDASFVVQLLSYGHVAGAAGAEGTSGSCLRYVSAVRSLPEGLSRRDQSRFVQDTGRRSRQRLHTLSELHSGLSAKGSFPPAEENPVCAAMSEGLKNTIEEIVAVDPRPTNWADFRSI